jgi:hypothetical protein
MSTFESRDDVIIKGKHAVDPDLRVTTWTDGDVTIKLEGNPGAVVLNIEDVRRLLGILDKHMHLTRG